jgi:hypothetical protein
LRWGQLRLSQSSGLDVPYGRVLVVSLTSPADPLSTERSTAVSDLTRQLLADRVVAEQWEHVRTYQAIDERTAAVVFADDLVAAAECASSSVEPLLPWPLLPEKQIGAFAGGVDLIRLHRIRQLVGDGDRVLEIGTGRG